MGLHKTLDYWSTDMLNFDFLEKGLDRKKPSRAGDFLHSLWYRRQDESAIASLDGYFMPKKNLLYEYYNFLSARQNSAKTINAFITHLQLLKKSCDYGAFEVGIIRDYVVMS